ncbi:hypothetical protein [Hyphomicrobium sp. CS1BSMeth3]|uniref:hypothetical protein n=1 Tax=Hyphomicrobium sp. CS1BSMeth3 TaxID=1892844 RepID=UPI000931DCE3|nr:hypothetical protein [Hyphomicrobium sp. CS1BSMeth3]
MAEHEFSPTRGVLPLTSRLSALAPVAGAAVTFGTLGAVHMAAAVLIGVLATFVAFAGLLMISDWQVEVQSRQEWAQLGLTPAHLSRAAEFVCERGLDPRYLAPSRDEALRQEFRIYRIAAQTTCSRQAPERPTGFPSAQLASDDVSAIGAASKADVAEGASPKVVGTRTAATRTASRKGRAKVVAPRVRLVANGNAWPFWATRIGPVAQGPAEVVVLGAGLDEQGQSQPKAPIDASKAERTEPANLHSTTNNSDTSAPRRVGRRVVTDDLGPKIPITREELDAIENYLEADLRKLFTSRKSGGAPEDI